MLHLNPRQVGYLPFLCLQMVYWKVVHPIQLAAVVQGFERPRHPAVAGPGFERPKHLGLAAAVAPDSELPKQQVAAAGPGFERPKHLGLAAAVAPDSELPR